MQPPVGGSRPQMWLCVQVTAPVHLPDKLWRSVLVVAQPGVQKGVQCAGGNEVKVLQGFGGGQDGRELMEQVATTSKWHAGRHGHQHVSNQHPACLNVAVGQSTDAGMCGALCCHATEDPFRRCSRRGLALTLLCGSRSSGCFSLRAKSHWRRTMSECLAARELQWQGLRPAQMGQPLPSMRVCTPACHAWSCPQAPL